MHDDAALTTTHDKGLKFKSKPNQQQTCHLERVYVVIWLPWPAMCSTFIIHPHIF